MRQYYGIENLNLNASQKQTLVDALRQLGASNQHTNPAHRNHWRTRLDNDAVIFEANWDTNDWTIDNIKVRLGNIFSVDPSAIDHAINQTQYGPIITLSHNATDYLRMVAFGGLGVAWDESHDAVLAYLAANIEDWEDSAL